MNEREQVLESVRPDRSKPTRVSLEKQRQILTHPDANDPNFEYRVVVDRNLSPGRIQKFIKAGYVHVLSGEGMGDDAVMKPKKIGAKVTIPVGNGETGYLMKIPKEYYREDQEDKERNLKETEKAFTKKGANEYGAGLVDDSK